MEELVEDLFNRDPLYDRQKELIAGYCSLVKTGIESAENRTAARSVLDTLCGRFRQECASEILGAVLTEHAEKLFHEKWGNE